MSQANTPQRNWRAAVCVGCVAVSLLLGNLYGFKTARLPDGSRMLAHGWPIVYLIRWPAKSSWDPYRGSPPASRWPFRKDANIPMRAPDLLPLSANISNACILILCTWRVLRQAKWQRRMWWQFRLGDLLILMTLYAIHLALLSNDRNYWQGAYAWKPLVFFPILLGIFCAARVVEHALDRLFSGE